MTIRFHFSYPRDGGPVACNCVIGIDHDNEDKVKAPLTAKQEVVQRTVADLVGQFVARNKDYLFTANQLEEAITTRMVTKEQITAWFAEELDKYFP